MSDVEEEGSPGQWDWPDEADEETEEDAWARARLYEEEKRDE